MKLCMSNIAWGAESDDEMYRHLAALGFSGLEIAPTRLFPSEPYLHPHDARLWAQRLFDNYGLRVASMQSIWYGRKENIFTDERSRIILEGYTRRAVLFARATECPNMVFGNPRARDTDDVAGNWDVAAQFFHAIGEAALRYGAVIALEPNPQIYGTRLMNTTREALAMAKAARSEGIRINYDLGAAIENGEDWGILREALPLVSHIHISEPHLKPIARREQMHSELLQTVAEGGYNGYISIEMGRTESLAEAKAAAEYLAELAKE